MGGRSGGRRAYNWLPEKVEALRAMIASGATQGAAAAHYGVRTQSIQDVCRRNGIMAAGSLGGGGRQELHPPELIEEVRRLAAERFSGRAIAEQLGMTRNAVVGLCWRNEIKLNSVRPRGKRKANAQPKAAPERATPGTIVDKRFAKVRGSLLAAPKTCPSCLGDGCDACNFEGATDHARRTPERRMRNFAPPALPPTDAVSFLDLRLFRSDMSNQCRRLLDGQHGMHGLVCAAPTPPGKSYCPACAARLMVPARDPIRTQIVPRRRAA